MIDKLIGFSIKNKLIVGLGVLGLIVWGSFALKNLPIDAVPDITNNQVQVITVAPSIAAQEVERLITYRVEQTMATIPGIVEIRSFSRFGLSVVTIVFEDDVEVYWARSQVDQRLSEAKNKIPNGIGTPEMAPVTTGLGEIYQYVLHTKKGYEGKYSAADLRTIQDWIVKRQLLGTPGVADVSSFGGYLKTYEIALDPQQLKAMEISIYDVFSALEKNNQNTGGAYIDKKPNAYFIRTEGLIGSVNDIEEIVVKNNASGIPILIKDVATVQFGNATRYGASVRNGEGEVTSAIVMMLKGANSAKVITDVKEKMEQIKKTLPEGVVIEPFLDRTKLVDNAIGTVQKNLLEGALIVIFILILFLGNFRAGLIVASVIPLAMLFAIGMMNMFGVSGNLMSLGAIDFGLIVDGAVIIVESILHRILTNKENLLTAKLSRQQMDEQVYNASTKIRSTAAFGEIIILIVYLPILALVGIEGKMFKPMAQTVSFAILGAFILSLTYVPMMSALALSRSTKSTTNFSDRMMNWFQKIYAPVLNLALRSKKSVLLIAGSLLLLAIIVFARMGGEFIPSLDEGDFALETRVMTGSSLSETIDASNKAAQLLLDNFPEVEQVVGKIGSGEIPTDPMPVEACDLMVILKDKDEWVSADSKDDLANLMAEKLKELPGVTFGFLQPIQMRFNELMTGARQDVVVKIYGEDLDVLSEQAAKVAKLVKMVDGAEDLYVEEVTGLPQYQVDYNREAIARHGLNIQDINWMVETAFAGKSAGSVYEGERNFDLVVKLKEEQRSSLEDLADLLIPTNDGGQIPLSQLATVSMKMGPSQIQRDDTKRRIMVGFNVRNRDVESVVNELQALVEKDIQFPSGYYATFGGQFQNLIEAKGRLMVAVPAALLLIFVLLYFTFRSVKQSLLIFTAIPLSAIGGVAALWFRDMPFSISAGVGFIALFGVAVLNGIVLIGEFNRLKKEGLELYERVRKGTAVRLRPILMTAAVASFGVLPMAISGSSGAEVQRPLATVVIGGLVTATFLTLVVLPILYILFESKTRKMKINSTTAIFIIACLIGSWSNAQVQLLSVDDAVAIALEKNLNIKAADLSVELSEANKKSSVDINKTQVSWQHGQYNSIDKRDNFISIDQTFAFPTVYVNRSKLNEAKITTSSLQRNLTEIQVIAQVKSAYYTLVLAKGKEQLLQELDSIISKNHSDAISNYNAGNSSKLDELQAGTKSMQIKNQLNNARLDVDIAETHLKMIMQIPANESIVLLNETTDSEKQLVNNDELSQVENHPSNLLNQSKLNELERQIALEKSKILPDISVGYFNTSLIGTQTVNGTDQYFGPRDRFQGFQVGVSIPIWVKPQIARVNAAKIEMQMNEALNNQAMFELQSSIVEAKSTVDKNLANLSFYEITALSQVEIMHENADVALSNGEISQSDYSIIIQQYIQTKMDYLDAINNYNQAVIQLDYLLGNK